MSALDFSFVEEARSLEVEAVEGGRALNEFTLDPRTSANPEEIPVVGKSVDDAEETEERVQLVRQFIEYARTAFGERGLSYPFQPSASGDSLEVLPGLGVLANRSAALSSMIRQGHSVAKDFEELGFRALHALIGGWGSCVGAPRRNHKGPKRAIDDFRDTLFVSEKGYLPPLDVSRNGDHGADGFLILGRAWGGPIVFYQAKNTNFDLKDPPEEFSRMPEILNDWFGKRWNLHRCVIPVLALNTVLTFEKKEQIYSARGTHAVQILDVADILCVEFIGESHACRQGVYTIF
jgi:hypothetical protein